MEQAWQLQKVWHNSQHRHPCVDYREFSPISVSNCQSEWLFQIDRLGGYPHLLTSCAPVEIPIPCTTQPAATCALGTGIDCSTSSVGYGVFRVTTTTCQKQSVDVDTGIDSYRFHCCDSSYANKIPMEYEHTTHMQMNYNTGLIGGSILNSQNTASMNMQAVLDIEFSATKYGPMGNINIPNGACLWHPSKLVDAQCALCRREEIGCVYRWRCEREPRY